jgi:anti-sigma factor ChrR (cupin superfamily)
VEQKLVWENVIHMDFDDPALPWQAFRDQVDLLPVYGNINAGCASAFLRYQPGARIPEHVHTGMEFLLILRGSQSDDRGHYTAGSFLINPTASSHKIISEEGCVVLAIWEKPVKFIDPQQNHY